MFSSFFVNSACHYCDALITHLAPFEGVLRFVDPAKCDVYKKKMKRCLKISQNIQVVHPLLCSYTRTNLQCPLSAFGLKRIRYKTINTLK